jgi:LytS/YehU family sensor histidine kinase
MSEDILLNQRVGDSSLTQNDKLLAFIISGNMVAICGTQLFVSASKQALM